MSYSVEFTTRAERDFLALGQSDQRRIARKVDALATNPRPPGCRKLSGPDGFYRIRIGDCRVIYRVEDRKLLVLVIRIGHRRDIYR